MDNPIDTIKRLRLFRRQRELECRFSKEEAPHVVDIVLRNLIEEGIIESADDLETVGASLTVRYTTLNPEPVRPVDDTGRTIQES